MASPLRKRFPRELKDNLGKYLGIFLLMSVTIALTSGFLLAAHSIGVIIGDMPEQYSIEDARFTTAFEATDEQLDAAADAASDAGTGGTGHRPQLVLRRGFQPRARRRRPRPHTARLSASHPG